MFKAIKQLFKEQFDLEIQEKRHYQIAFTHSSYVNEKRKENLEDNERIEFLGDAVLELTVSNFLYHYFPQLPEGDLSRIRALIVCEESLSKRCKECGFDQYVRLGHGEEANGGRERSSLLCDLFEAVVGALYLDLGLDAIEKFLEQTIYPKIESGEFKDHRDNKTALQEELQKDGQINLSYRLLKESGPSHNKRFEVAVCLDGEIIGQGQGTSKKHAEQAAAKQALEDIQKDK
ncbi:ribonuclease III [Aerococcus urinae]|uniref:ribonuclease III n=1 Tax=Aerococcus urinae TaxID=1376 RepID=UPI0018E0D9AE|nr:ribonuclease III [Aerococcus urinae]